MAFDSALGLTLGTIDGILDRIAKSKSNVENVKNLVPVLNRLKDFLRFLALNITEENKRACEPFINALNAVLTEFDVHVELLTRDPNLTRNIERWIRATQDQKQYDDLSAKLEVAVQQLTLALSGQGVSNNQRSFQRLEHKQEALQTSLTSFRDLLPMISGIPETIRSSVNEMTSLLRELHAKVDHLTRGVSNVAVQIGESKEHVVSAVTRAQEQSIRTLQQSIGESKDEVLETILAAQARSRREMQQDLGERTAELTDTFKRETNESRLAIIRAFEVVGSATQNQMKQSEDRVTTTLQREIRQLSDMLQRQRSVDAKNETLLARSETLLKRKEKELHQQLAQKERQLEAQRQQLAAERAEYQRKQDEETAQKAARAKAIELQREARHLEAQKQATEQSLDDTLISLFDTLQQEYKLSAEKAKAEENIRMQQEKFDKTTLPGELLFLDAAFEQASQRRSQPHPIFTIELIGMSASTKSENIKKYKQTASASGPLEKRLAAAYTFLANQDPASMYKLAICYYLGIGVKRNVDVAEQYFFRQLDMLEQPNGKDSPQFTRLMSYILLIEEERLEKAFLNNQELARKREPQRPYHISFMAYPYRNNFGIAGLAPLKVFPLGVTCLARGSVKLPFPVVETPYGYNVPLSFVLDNPQLFSKKAVAATPAIPAAAAAATTPTATVPQQQQAFIADSCSVEAPGGARVPSVQHYSFYRPSPTTTAAAAAAAYAAPAQSVSR